MNSRFKYIKSVDPQAIQITAGKQRLGKLALASTKQLVLKPEITSPRKMDAINTEKLPNDPNGPDESNYDQTNVGQKPNILLYESTIQNATTIDDDNPASDILTDDDTDSVRSSIYSIELDGEIQSTQQSVQTNVDNINLISSQMHNLSVISIPDEKVASTKDTNAPNLMNLSQRFHDLDISKANTEENEINEHDKSISISTQESTGHDNDKRRSKTNEVIVISDTDSEEDNMRVVNVQQQQRRISEEPPFKPNCPSDNDGAAFNITSSGSNALNSQLMQKVNDFFNNIPYMEACENSFNTTMLSKSVGEAVYVSETSDDESTDPSKHDSHQQLDESSEQQMDKQNNLEFSDNNIVVDIPVVKSSSDQPKASIRSYTGVQLTASHSSPIIKTKTSNALNTNSAKKAGNTLMVTKTGSTITVNSVISAKININIQISSGDCSSSEASSDDKERATRESLAAQSHSDENGDSDVPVPSNQIDPSNNKSCDSRNHSLRCDTNNLDEVKNNTLRQSNVDTEAALLNESAKHERENKNLPKTPSTASKLKQFEYVPPKSITKSVTKKSSAANNRTPIPNSQVETNETNADGFKVDESIPVSERDQKLLHRLYGEAWKTPEVIRSYSAIKGKAASSADRAAVNKSPTSLKKLSRYSKGFNLFKRNINDNLNSTRLDATEVAEVAEISIIEPPPVPVNPIKTPKKTPAKTPAKSLRKTPAAVTKTSERSKTKSPSRLDVVQQSPSQSMISKFRPRQMEKLQGRSAARNKTRKRLLQSPDENDLSNLSTEDKDNISDYSSLLTEDSDSDFSPSSTNSKKPATKLKRPTTKRCKNKLVYLDLSSEEVVEVQENQCPHAPEEDIANMTKHFFEDERIKENEVKPKKKGRKLFTPQYVTDDEEEEDIDEPKSNRKKPTQNTNVVLDIEIPQFTNTKLFDSKRFGSPSVRKMPEICTPPQKFKTPAIPATLPSMKHRSESNGLGSPPRTFQTYGFLKSLDVCSSMLLCHPDARKFRENFKSNKEELTQILYALFNEKVFDGKLDCDVVWNKKLTTTAGRFCSKLKGYTKPIIELSEKVLTSADRLRCTLIHEMCHAATWIFDKQKGHGATWKSWAKRANNKFPELPTITVCHNYDIEYKYTYKCDMCANKSYSHSKSRKVENIRCSYCHGSISIYLNKKQNDQIVMTPVRQASGFSKYVREFYKVHKKPGVTHIEVMKILSVEYGKLTDEEKKNL